MKKFCKYTLLFVLCILIGAGLFCTSGYKLTAYAYTEEEKAAAKAWLAANGYSPTMSGAEQAYQDYLNGKFGPVGGDTPSEGDLPQESADANAGDASGTQNDTGSISAPQADTEDASGAQDNNTEDVSGVQASTEDTVGAQAGTGDTAGTQTAAEDTAGTQTASNDTVESQTDSEGSMPIQADMQQDASDRQEEIKQKLLDIAVIHNPLKGILDAKYAVILGSNTGEGIGIDKLGQEEDAQPSGNGEIAIIVIASAAIFSISLIYFCVIRKKEKK